MVNFNVKSMEKAPMLS